MNRPSDLRSQRFHALSYSSEATHTRTRSITKEEEFAQADDNACLPRISWQLLTEREKFLGLIGDRVGKTKTPRGARVSKPKSDKRRLKSKKSSELAVLYAQALPAKRTGSLFCAFPYPTKISPEAIALFIAAHTKPGDTIFDGFAGSGTTGLAAILCEKPSPELRSEAKRLNLPVKWGPRNAVLYELSSLGAFVGSTLTNPPNPQAFRKAASKILCDAEREDGWLYEASDPDGGKGTIRYLVWSDMLSCKKCSHETTYWDACASRNPARLSTEFKCRSCGQKSLVGDTPHAVETAHDDLLGKQVERRASRMVWLYGQTGRKKWSRPITKDDLKLFDRIASSALPSSVPKVEVPWGDLYRSGYHQGISHLHQFYTRRNLIAFARLWERTKTYKGALGDALRFWLLSYNSSHATIMTRIVAKTGQSDFVVTSGQPGVLYVSSLPVEKNLFLGLQRKLTTIADAFELVRGHKGDIKVVNGSSCKVALKSNSIDYAFTDPPFGGNIPYSEINFLNEAWLGTYTDRTEEAIVSTAQEKSVDDYKQLLTSALSEVRRILKPKGKVTLVFHSATAEIWSALQEAYREAGLSVETAGVLDKTQGSFKQVTTTGAVRGDPLLLLIKANEREETGTRDVWQVADRLRKRAGRSSDPSERTAQRMYSRLVSHLLVNNQTMSVDADSFYRWHASLPPIELTAGVGD